MYVDVDVMEADVVVEDMDQTTTSSAPTSVIVNVTGVEFIVQLKYMCTSVSSYILLKILSIRWCATSTLGPDKPAVHGQRLFRAY